MVATLKKKGEYYYCSWCMMRQYKKLRASCRWCGAVFSNYEEIIIQNLTLEELEDESNTTGD